MVRSVVGRVDQGSTRVASFSHPKPVESLGAVRAKIFGHAFKSGELLGILQDMSVGRYTDIELAAFLTASAAVGMSLDEVVSLTRGMVQVGEPVQPGGPEGEAGEQEVEVGEPRHPVHEPLAEGVAQHPPTLASHSD